MKKTIRKAISLVLLLVMLIPTTAFAATGSDYYRDEYFGGSSSTYNNHMATSSMLLAFAGCNLGDAQVKTAFEGMGCTDIQSRDFDAASKDAVALAVATKELSDGVYVVPVVFRGAKYTVEWARNVETGTSGDAKGYSAPAATAVQYVNDYVSKLNEKGAKSVYIWVNGYSRGASLGNLAAKALTDKYGMDNVYAYLFEGPKSAASASTNSSYTNIHNVYNVNSPISVVMPKYMGFGQYGNVDKSIGSKRNVTWQSLQLKVKPNVPLMSQLTSLMSSDIMTYEKKGSTTVGEFWKVVATRLEKAIESRKAYTKAPSSSSNNAYAAKKLGVTPVSMEQGTMALVGMAMSGQIDITNLNLNISSLLSDAMSALGAIDKVKDAILTGKKISLSNDDYYKLVKLIDKAAESAAKLNADQKIQLKQGLCAMLEPLLKYVAADYKADKQTLGTLLNAGESVIADHYPEGNVELMKKADSYFTSGAKDTVCKVPTAAKLSKLTAAKKAATASWKKVSGVSGYEVQYSLKKNMSASTIKNVASSKKSYKITKLTSKKTYYVRVRSYKKYNGVKNYSKWSSAKKIKVK